MFWEIFNYRYIMMEKPKVSLFKQKIKEARQKREEEGMQV